MARILTEEYRAGRLSLRACIAFSSGAALARAALDLGFYLSMSGIAAFPKSQDLRDIFAASPLDRILLETDSPYLAPPPHRGKAQRAGLHRAYRTRRGRGVRPRLRRFRAGDVRKLRRLFWKAAAWAKAA